MKHTIRDVRALAERSGFDLIRNNIGLYNLTEVETGRKLMNKNGSPQHMDADELYDTLTTRA
jgi:hypothetical protein